MTCFMRRYFCTQTIPTVRVSVYVYSNSPYSFRMCGLRRRGNRRSAVRFPQAAEDTRYVLLYLAQEPELGQVTDDRQGEDELAAADQCQAEESGPTHDLGVIEEPITRGYLVRT